MVSFHSYVNVYHYVKSPDDDPSLDLFPKAPPKADGLAESHGTTIYICHLAGMDQQHKGHRNVSQQKISIMGIWHDLANKKVVTGT